MKTRSQEKNEQQWRMRNSGNPANKSPTSSTVASLLNAAEDLDRPMAINLDSTTLLGGKRKGFMVSGRLRNSFFPQQVPMGGEMEQSTRPTKMVLRNSE